MEEKELQQPMSRSISPKTLWRGTYFQHYSSMPKIKNKNYDEAKMQSACKITCWETC
jgi:hypothetical protein